MDPRLDAVTAELRMAVGGVDPAEADRLCDAIVGAKQIMVFGCGRERLQLLGFSMRLFHMGFSVMTVGDVYAPPVGPGDLLIVTSGPGELATVGTVMDLAKRAGASTFVITAQRDGPDARAADSVLVIPAQTMADDRGEQKRSVLPMGSVFEGALFVLFELLVMRLRDRLGVGLEDMRARHANLE
ncbi:MAG TPA: SIS domain-containing protein [Mesorhizobium sp.]|jgi:6-phospho-3-hexuloisomerase|nr:SIS domain-containing protein [Mesorhizobium sp.]